MIIDPNTVDQLTKDYAEAIIRRGKAEEAYKLQRTEQNRLRLEDSQQQVEKARTRLRKMEGFTE